MLLSFFSPFLSLSLSLSLRISFSDECWDSQEVRKEFLGKIRLLHQSWMVWITISSNLCSRFFFWIKNSLSDECRNSEVRKELLGKFWLLHHALITIMSLVILKWIFQFHVKNIITLIILTWLNSFLLSKRWCMIGLRCWSALASAIRGISMYELRCRSALASAIIGI